MIGKKSKMYAGLLLEVLEGKSRDEARKIIKNFLVLLRKRGDIRLGCQVAKELQILEEEKEGKPGIVVSAKPLHSEVKKQLEDSLARKGFSMREIIEPDVIEGLAIFLGKEYMIDGTVQGMLQKLSKFIHHA